MFWGSERGPGWWWLPPYLLTTLLACPVASTSELSHVAASPTPLGPPFEDFCQERWKQTLLALSACNGGDPADWSTIAALIADNFGQYYDCRLLRRRVDAGLLRYVPERGAACLGALEASECVALLTTPRACRDALVPARGLGEACGRTTFGCAPGSVCTGTSACTSRCVPASVPAGEVCEYPDRLCAPDLYCAHRGNEQDRCMAQPAIGDACFVLDSFPEECGRLGCALDRCIAPILEGGSCSTAEEQRFEDRSWPCAAGLQCVGHFGDQRCMRPLRVGAPCDHTADIDPCSFVGLRCASSGRCVRLQGLGEPCATNGECAWPGRCVQGLCAVQLEYGDPCEAGTACWSGLCGADKACGLTCD